MKRSSLALSALVAAAWIVMGTSAHANTIGTFGDATGDLVIHYNTGGETPANQAYVTTANTTFNFNENLGFPVSGYGSSHFFQAIPDQFQFNLSTLLPTANGTNPSPGSTTALHANYNDTNPSTQSQSVDWAITDPTYQNPTSGRTGNSVFRGGTGDGSSINWTQTLSQSGTLFTLTLDGTLTNDGKIWWANSAGNGDGTSNLSDFPWFFLVGTDTVSFHGTFTYDSATDLDPLADVYHGSINFNQQLPTAVPLPASAWAGLALLGCLGLTNGLKRLRRHEA
jgi:hypothetical protein